MVKVGKGYIQMYKHIVKRKDNYPRTFLSYLNFLAKHKNKIRVLDIGCMNGSFLTFINDYIKNINPNCVVELFGVDIEDVSEILPNNIKFYRVDVDNEPLPFESETFDIINIDQVLEHLYYPWKVLKEIKRVLNKEGIVYLGVPSHRTLFIFDAPNHFFWDITHIKPYSKAGLERFLKELGFEIIDINYIKAKKITTKIKALLGLIKNLLIKNYHGLNINIADLIGINLYVVFKKGGNNECG